MKRWDVSAEHGASSFKRGRLRREQLAAGADGAGAGRGGAAAAEGQGEGDSGLKQRLVDLQENSEPPLHDLYNG